MEDNKDSKVMNFIKRFWLSIILLILVIINICTFYKLFSSEKFAKYLSCSDLKFSKNFTNKTLFNLTSKTYFQNNFSYSNYNIRDFKQIKNDIHNLNIKIKDLLTFNNKLEYNIKVINKLLMELECNFYDLSKKINKIYNCSCENKTSEIKNIHKENKKYLILNISYSTHNKKSINKVREKINNINISNPWKINEKTNETVIIIDP